MQLAGVTLSASYERTIFRQCCAELSIQTAAAISIMASLVSGSTIKAQLRMKADPAG
jgi:hypothetical protein